MCGRFYVPEDDSIQMIRASLKNSSNLLYNIDNAIQFVFEQSSFRLSN